jgi:hypothetical protein
VGTPKYNYLSGTTDGAANGSLTLMAQQMAMLVKACLTDVDGNPEGCLTDSDGSPVGSPD